MFRFTIRELFLLTLVTGLVIGWWLDHSKLSQALTTAKTWRNVAGALEHVLDELGWKSRWDSDAGDVRVMSKKEDGTTYSMTLEFWEPSHLLGNPISN